MKSGLLVLAATRHGTDQTQASEQHGVGFWFGDGRNRDFEVVNIEGPVIPSTGTKSQGVVSAYNGVKGMAEMSLVC